MVVSFLFFANQSDATCTGCLSLDLLTFDKVLSKFKTVLIKVKFINFINFNN